MKLPPHAIIAAVLWIGIAAAFVIAVIALTLKVNNL